MSLGVLALAFVLDLFFGDPHWLPHPVCLIGKIIEKGEKIIRNRFSKSQKGEYIGGMVLSAIVVMVSFLVPYGLLLLVKSWSTGLCFLLESIMCYQIIAAKSLKTESMHVYQELMTGDILSARKAVSMIVGRDTQNLSEKQITKATIETVAENTSDGVVAPLLFMAFGGAPLGFAYKAINTLDSMIGYKNDKYLYFGRFGAKLDDFANYIPARISAYTMIIASFILKLDSKNAYKIYNRDRRNHSSPNSAHTEAVAAGALHIQLAGNAYYFGKLYKKPAIGDLDREVEYCDIIKTNNLMYLTGILVLFISLFIRFLI